MLSSAFCAATSVPRAPPPIPFLKTERERQREHHAGEDDEEGLAHDVAADVDLVERDENHEGDDRVLREPPEELRVLDVHVPAVRGDGVGDEAREVAAEGEHQQRDQHLGHEQNHAAEQVGDVGEAEAVEAHHERAEDHQPVDHQADDLGGVGGDAAVAQEAVEAGALRDDVEVHRAQPLHDGEARRLASSRRPG